MQKFCLRMYACRYLISCSARVVALRLRKAVLVQVAYIIVCGQLEWQKERWLSWSIGYAHFISSHSFSTHNPILRFLFEAFKLNRTGSFCLNDAFYNSEVIAALIFLVVSHFFLFIQFMKMKGP